MNSPALMLICAFKITCILRSSVDRYRGQLLRRWSASKTHLIILIHISFGVYNCTEHTCIKIIYLMQWMMLFAYLLLYYVVILYMTSSAPERFRRSWFWGVTDWYQSIVYSELSISTHKRYTKL